MGSSSFPTWRIRSNLTANWNYGNFGASWTARYFSRLEEEGCLTTQSGAIIPETCSDPGRQISTGAAPRNHMGAATYHDVQARWNAPWNGTVTLGIINAFAKEPPFSGLAFANSFDYQYDTPGRYYYMEYRQRF